MPRTSRAATDARNQILTMLKDDHKRVKKAYRQFTRLDCESDAEQCEQIVQQVLAELELHTTLEEELLYPAARDAIKDPDLIDEAEVEHESAKALMQQLQGMDSHDEKFVARFTVLCEYVLHHVKEEENELFPQMESARLDWEGLLAEVQARRAELEPAGNGDDGAMAMAVGDSERGSPRRAAGKTTGGVTGGAKGPATEGEGMAPGEATTSRKI
jgi:hemerythrin superfamily protein